jgi:hypothetical protein
MPRIEAEAMREKAECSGKNKATQLKDQAMLQKDRKNP